MISIDAIRRIALALPEVEEISHHRFRVPVFKVKGTTFAGLGRDEASAVFRVSQEEAAAAAAADPDTYEAVRRPDARKSFLGLQVDLASVSEDRVRELVDHAWRERAPKRLVAEHDTQC